MSGNFLSCSKGVKLSLIHISEPTRQAEMGLISPGGQNLLDFLESRKVLSTYDGDLRDPLWWPQEKPVPMRVARRPLGMGWEPREFFPDQTGKDPSSRAMRRKRGSSGCGRDPRASSRVETGISGNVLSSSKGVKDLLEVPEVRCD